MITLEGTFIKIGRISNISIKKHRAQNGPLWNSTCNGFPLRATIIDVQSVSIKPSVSY
jgi:hypothetical protein